MLGITVYLVVRRLIRKNKVEDQPLMILKERYAKGEITDDEYQQKRKVLDRG
ncbi:SHOCT domain-containing protein [Ammoniphilus sp. 3BR4]|uniref:SHOCT domain-containing protein n=1 Tax=Ammoniphilus sp. 3BR4 TaxID=3158265 RepID=UPI003467B171